MNETPEEITNVAAEQEPPRGADATEFSSADPFTTLRRRIRQIAAVLGGVLLGGLTITWWQTRPPLPPLTPESFTAARSAWESHGPASYRIEVTVAGRQAAHYRVDVVQGEVTQALRNGQPLAQHRTLGTWSVPGMFDTIALDLESRQQHAAGTATPGVPNVVLRCHFDPQFGYPAHYHRLELLGAGGNSEASWIVTRFEPAGL